MAATRARIGFVGLGHMGGTKKKRRERRKGRFVNPGLRSDRGLSLGGRALVERATAEEIQTAEALRPPSRPPVSTVASLPPLRLGLDTGDDGRAITPIVAETPSNAASLVFASGPRRCSPLLLVAATDQASPDQGTADIKTPNLVLYELTWVEKWVETRLERLHASKQKAPHCRAFCSSGGAGYGPISDLWIPLESWVEWPTSTA